MRCGHGGSALSGHSTSQRDDCRTQHPGMAHQNCSHRNDASTEDYAWVGQVLKSGFFSDTMKCGLRNMTEILNITQCGLLLDEGKVSWEKEEGEKNTATQNDEAVCSEEPRSSITKRRGSPEKETKEKDGGGREAAVGKRAKLEQGNEEDGTLGSA